MSVTATLINEIMLPPLQQETFRPAAIGSSLPDGFTGDGDRLTEDFAAIFEKAMADESRASAFPLEFEPRVKTQDDPSTADEFVGLQAGTPMVRPDRPQREVTGWSVEDDRGREPVGSLFQALPAFSASDHFLPAREVPRDSAPHNEVTLPYPGSVSPDLEKQRIQDMSQLSSVPGPKPETPESPVFVQTAFQTQTGATKSTGAVFMPANLPAPAVHPISAAQKYPDFNNQSDIHRPFSEHQTPKSVSFFPDAESTILDDGFDPQLIEQKLSPLGSVGKVSDSPLETEVSVLRNTPLDPAAVRTVQADRQLPRNPVKQQDRAPTDVDWSLVEIGPDRDRSFEKGQTASRPMDRSTGVFATPAHATGAYAVTGLAASLIPKTPPLEAVEARMSEAVLPDDFPVPVSATLSPLPMIESEPIRKDASRPLLQQVLDASVRAIERPVELHLNPEELGRVRISMLMSDGLITLSVLAERVETLDLMRRHSDQLAQELRQLGYGTINFSFGQQERGREGRSAISRADSSSDVNAHQAGSQTRYMPSTHDTGLDIRV